MYNKNKSCLLCNTVPLALCSAISFDNIVLPIPGAPSMRMMCGIGFGSSNVIINHLHF